MSGRLIEAIVDYDCDSLFLSFIHGLLEWDPESRLTPGKALIHPWILEGMPKEIRKAHVKQI